MSRLERNQRHQMRPDAPSEFGDSSQSIDSSGYSVADDPAFAGMTSIANASSPKTIHVPFPDLAPGQIAWDPGSSNPGWTPQHAIKPAPIEYQADQDAALEPGL